MTTEKVISREDYVNREIKMSQLIYLFRLKSTQYQIKGQRNKKPVTK